MRYLTLIFALLALLLSTTTLAHPGHDHNAAGSGLLHLLWLVPFIIAATVVVFKEITTVADGTDDRKRR
jgi:hypothetical protein